MRVFRTSTLALLPAALIAQAPTNSSQLKTEQKTIEDLVKAYKAKEALTRAEALIAGPKPAYDKKDLNTLAQSQNAYRDLVSAHIAAANAAIAAGQWERATEILEKGASLAKENQTLFTEGSKSALESWTKAETDAKTFLEAYPSKSKALKDHLDQVAAKRKEAETKKLGKAEREALNQELTKAQEEANELTQMDADKKVNEDNLQRVGKIHGFVNSITADCKTVLDLVNTSIAKHQARVKEQADQIKEYEAKQAEKKAGKKKAAPTTWVEAVMNDHQNVEKLAPAAQVSFLNRLLVLEPKNEKAQKTLANVVAGKAPFEAEKKAAKGKKR